jgi:hypothetical protein
MPIEILGAMVVVGLAVAILAVRFSGLSKPARIGTADQAMERFRQDYPDETVSDCRLTANRDAAFLRLTSGGVGLVTAFGAKYVTRYLAAGKARTKRQGSRLELILYDFTWPRARAEFASPLDAETVAGWIEGKRE